MSEQLPTAYQTFTEEYPEVWAAYEQLGAAAHAHGPLDDKTRELVKLALSIGVGSEGAVHAHTRKALAKGAGPEEIRHVVLLAITTVGFPAAQAARTWVEDILSG